MDDKNKRVAAIIVDYDYYVLNTKVRRFVDEREDKAVLVLLVGTPHAEDPDNAPENLPEPAWNVVIRNTPDHPDREFKQHALNALSLHSNLSPALAIDIFNSDIYDEAGVLLTLDGGYFG